MTSAIVYLNEKFVQEKKAFIPATDRGFLFGEGVFTTIKVNDGIPELLHLHLEKLECDCYQLGIILQKISDQLIDELIEKNNAQSGIWRLKIIASRGERLGLDCEKWSVGQFLITLKPYAGHAFPCRLTCYPYPMGNPSGRVKSLSRLDSFWIADYAKEHGFDDALVLDHQGRVLETAFANLFWRSGNILFYPDPVLPLYQGVTLQIVLAAAKKMGLHSSPVQVRLADILEDVQMYQCNSLKGIVPVACIDNRNFNRDLPFEYSLIDELDPVV